MNDMNFFKPMVNIKLGSNPSVLKLASVAVGVFVTVFVLLFVIFNGPLIISLVKYPLTHSEQADNERLTAQYIALYGSHNQEKPSQAGQPVLPIAQAAVHMPSLPVVHDNRITISKIGITAPIIQVLSDDEKLILNALKGGVVLYPGSEYPGQGSTIIIGHSSSNPPWTKYSAIFSLLNKLAPNDLVNVSFEGKEYTYRVKATVKGSVQQIMNSDLGGDLILSSCWPVGTDQGRITVVADLVR